MAGNANSGRKVDKLWGDALRLAVMRETDGGKSRLAAIAEKTVLMAMDGDLGAVREIGDRLDGKPAQAIIGDPDAPLAIEFRTIYEDKR
jgi:hypothetical protein